MGKKLLLLIRLIFYAVFSFFLCRGIFEFDHYQFVDENGNVDLWSVAVVYFPFFFGVLIFSELLLAALTFFLRSRRSFPTDTNLL